MRRNIKDNKHQNKEEHPSAVSVHPRFTQIWEQNSNKTTLTETGAKTTSSLKEYSSHPKDLDIAMHPLRLSALSLL